MEDEYVEDELVENVTDCPGCGEYCGHEILKERKAGEGTDYLLKCLRMLTCSHRPIATTKTCYNSIPFSEGAHSRLQK